MKRSGFTMIELVFIIVILGILAAIAVPKMAATRDDARAVAVKADIGTMTQAIPAMYMSKGDSFNKITDAVNLDTSRWTMDNSDKTAIFKVDGANCATVALDTTAKTLTITVKGYATGASVTACTILRDTFGNDPTPTTADYTQTINLASSGITFN